MNERAAIFDDPYIRRLVAQALKLAGADLKAGDGEVVIKSKVKKDGVTRKSIREVIWSGHKKWLWLRSPITLDDARSWRYSLVGRCI